MGLASWPRARFIRKAFMCATVSCTTTASRPRGIDPIPMPGAPPPGPRQRLFGPPLAGLLWLVTAAIRQHLRVTTTGRLWYIKGTRFITTASPLRRLTNIANRRLKSQRKATQSQPPESEGWVSLGVFGMVQGDEKDANNIFQLAVNKQGIIRGNYYNALTDTTTPVYGSVDKSSQRAAWTVGDKKETVYETGIGNLTEPETPILVHFGKDRTQQWTLVRMEQPVAGN